jgi:SAM-dependent methyltransferase
MAAERAKARQLAQDFLARGDATGWFEALYAGADGDEKGVPWADMTVNPNFASWLARHPLTGSGRKALVVGCGLGDDAEELARRGFDVTAFDISATAIDWCRQRFPTSLVHYCTVDLFASPTQWTQPFDFVLEAYTLQVLPAALRPRAMQCIASYLAPGGMLLVIARGREASEDPGQMPWPLTREELGHFAACGLHAIALEDYLDDEQPPVRRFRAEFQRPANT